MLLRETIDVYCENRTEHNIEHVVSMLNSGITEQVVHIVTTGLSQNLFIYMLKIAFYRSITK
jgi:hypothetical protein